MVLRCMTYEIDFGCALGYQHTKMLKGQIILFVQNVMATIEE